MTFFKISGEGEGLKNIEGHTVSLKTLTTSPQNMKAY